MVSQHGVVSQRGVVSQHHVVSQQQRPAARYPTAPLDAAALAGALRPFGQSTMLPPGAYADPAVFAWEREHFLGGGSDL